MVDAGFFVRDDQKGRNAACYSASAAGAMNLPTDATGTALVLSDDPTHESLPGSRPKLESGGGGLVSTAADYLRFANMLANGGELDGQRILSPMMVRLMASNHLPGGQDLTQLSRSLFSESTYAGIGFGLGFAVVFDPAEDPDPLLAGRVLLGRRGLQASLLGRSGGVDHGGVHDPAHAVVDLSDPPRASDPGLFRPDGKPGVGGRRQPPVAPSAARPSSRSSSAMIASLSSIIGWPRPVSGASALGVRSSIRERRQPPQPFQK